MKIAGRSLLVSLALAAVAATLALMAGNSATAQGPTTLAVDPQPDGNTATSLGTREACRRIEAGAAFDIDITLADVQDLRTWELTFGYDPDLIEVVNKDARLFLAANAGSNILQISDPLPDTDGQFVLGASDASDHTDSGSGAIVRLTLQSKGTGVSPLSLPQIDLNDDGKTDLGPLLHDAAGLKIGDVTGDEFFDGPTYHSQVAIGTDCPSATPTPTLPTPTATPGPGGGGEPDGGDGGDNGQGDGGDSPGNSGAPTAVLGGRNPGGGGNPGGGDNPGSDDSSDDSSGPGNSGNSNGGGSSDGGGSGGDPKPPGISHSSGAANWPWLASAVGGMAVALAAAGVLYRLNLRGRGHG